MKKPWKIFAILFMLNPWKLKYPRNFQGRKTPVTRRGFKLGTFCMYGSYLDLLCHMPCTIPVLSSSSWSMP